MSTRIIIAGSRTFTHWPQLETACSQWVPEGAIILCGGARGADALGAKYARTYGHTIEHYPADWKTHGKMAGPLRNEEMAKVADLALVFWDGRSRGTRSLLQACKRHQVRVKVFL